MWGSTSPNTADECTWTNTPFNGEASDYDSDYFNSVKDTVCPNGILAKECDAASHIMGGDWRMPTDAEIQELIDNTTNEWIADYNDTGVNGYKFTGSNGNSIFIRAAGYRVNSSFELQDYLGFIWSSSFFTSGHPKNAGLLFFNSSTLVASGGFRSKGYAVRGVL